MLNVSRMSIYDYLYDLFHGVVTDNVYKMNVPAELTKSDTTEGFLVIRVGDIYDNSEFDGNAYATARCYVKAYIPTKSRGRLNEELYTAFEDAIINILQLATTDDTRDYYVEEGSILSTDGVEQPVTDNRYFAFVKSFVVVADNKS